MGGDNHRSADTKTLLAPELLGFDNRNAFCAEALELLEALPPGNGCLVIDFARTLFVDASAVGTLAEVQGTAATNRHVVRLRNVSEEIRSTLLLARMDQLFEFETPGVGE
jgi:anti-anti-sigma regulatory factor